MIFSENRKSTFPDHALASQALFFYKPANPDQETELWLFPSEKLRRPGAACAAPPTR
jgi:hypothetical protein